MEKDRKVYIFIINCESQKKFLCYRHTIYRTDSCSWVKNNATINDKVFCKNSIIGQEQKTLISASVKFLIAILSSFK